MAISRISSASNNSTSVTIGTHDANDLILIMAFNDGSSTAPTLASGWINVRNTGGNNTGYVLAYKIATSNAETSGTWTNADVVVAIVYRGGTNCLVIPAWLSDNTFASGTTITLAAQPAGTFPTNISDFGVLGFCQSRSASNSLATNVFSGMTNIGSATDGSVWELAWHDQLPRTTAWPSTSITVANSAAHRAILFGLYEITYPSAGSSGFRPVNIRGGADQ